MRLCTDNNRRVGRWKHPPRHGCPRLGLRPCVLAPTMALELISAATRRSGRARLDRGKIAESTPGPKGRPGQRADSIDAIRSAAIDGVATNGAGGTIHAAGAADLGNGRRPRCQLTLTACVPMREFAVSFARMSSFIRRYYSQTVTAAGGTNPPKSPNNRRGRFRRLGDEPGRATELCELLAQPKGRWRGPLDGERLVVGVRALGPRPVGGGGRRVGRSGHRVAELIEGRGGKATALRARRPTGRRVARGALCAVSVALKLGRTMVGGRRGARRAAWRAGGGGRVAPERAARMQNVKLLRYVVELRS